MSEPVPINVVTGALGVGKTSVIGSLLANKPVDEFWVVILNEFTDVGVDALTLASVARGPYDVRTIPGGCLCCTGELTFRQQLRSILSEVRPQRILIEPSGIGHPGAVIEELRGQERAGAVKLMSVIGLVDPKRLTVFASKDIEFEQLEAADVLLLNKSDMASAADQAAFLQAAHAMFPPKRWIGICSAVHVPAEALAPPAPVHSFVIADRPALHVREAEQHHAHAPQMDKRSIPMSGATVEAHAYALLERHACGWLVPREITFDRPKLLGFLTGVDSPLLASVERFKAVIRTGINHWTLVNKSPAGVSTQACGWRQDSRIEVQLQPGAEVDWRRWDQLWNEMIAK